jgi:hypothetical protein
MNISPQSPIATGLSGPCATCGQPSLLQRLFVPDAWGLVAKEVLEIWCGTCKREVKVVWHLRHTKKMPISL